MASSPKPNPFAKKGTPAGGAKPAKGGKPMPPWLKPKAPGMKAGGKVKSC